MSGQIFKSIEDKYLRFLNQATFQVDGQDYEVSLGDLSDLKLTPEYKDIERASNEFSMETIVRIDTIGIDYKIALSTKSFTRQAAAALWGDNDGTTAAQASATGLTKTFMGIKVGRIYNLGHENVTVNSADDGSVTPISFELGVHYSLNEELGRIEILSIPAGATQLEVTFDAAAITSTDDIAVYGGGNSNGIIGTLRLYGISNIGQNYCIEIWRVRLRPTGDITFIASDYSDLALEGRVLADRTKVEKFRFFKVREIAN